MAMTSRTSAVADKSALGQVACVSGRPGLLFLAKFLTDPIWWFFLFWLPDYFDKTFHLNVKQPGWPLAIIYSIDDDRQHRGRLFFGGPDQKRLAGL